MSRRFVFAIALVTATLVVGSLTADTARADQVGVRAWPHDNFMRLVFDWKQPVTYEARVDGDQLIVTFDRQIESDFRQVRDNLKDAIQDITVADEGRMVRFALSGEHSVRHFVLDGSVVVDVTPVSSAATADAVKNDLPAVAVRVGEHADFSRLVFDWPDRVNYEVTQQDGVARVTFARPADLGLAAVRGDLPAGLQGITATNDGRNVELTLAPNTGVRDFRDGPRVVVDLRRGESAAAEATGPEIAPVAETEPIVAEPLAPVDGAPVEAPVDDQVANAPIALTPAPTAVAEPDDAAGEPTALGALEALAENEPQVLVDEQVARIEPEPKPEPEVAEAVAEAAPVALSAPISLVPVAEPVSLADLPVIDTTFTPEAGGGTLVFAVDEPGAAVFRRGGYLWVVLAQVGQIDLTQLRSAAGDVIVTAAQLPVDVATVLRMETITGFNPVITDAGNGFALDLRPQIMAPAQAVDVMAIETEQGTAVRIDVAGALEPIALQDPELGDVITIVPVAGAGVGVADDREFVAVQLPKSAQGVVVASFDDDLSVARLDDAVLVAGAIAVTPDEERQRIRDAAAGQNVLPRMFDFAAWRLEDDEMSFIDARHALLARVGRTESEDINVARLDLARFMFAHGRASEAIGVLSAIAADADQASREPDFRALRGASLFLLGRHEGAAPDLGDRGLDGEPEIGVWRAALAADQGEWETAALGLRASELYVQRYPDRLRVRFSLLGAEAMLRVDDPIGAESFLVSLDGVEMEPGEQARFDLLKGQLEAVLGENEAALASFTRAIDGEDRRARALATLARADLALALEEITVAEAVEELDQLRFVWRGDDIELEVLSRLGDLHIEDGAFRSGLQTLKRAATNYSDHPRVADLTTRMQETFESLFVGGDAEQLPALQAIALFNQFRELTPAGPEGDDMIRRLAERLVSVDLLEQAASLLTHQVDFRVDGENKAEVGARLAVVRLLDRRPEGALEALEISLVDDISDGVKQERRLLEARAKAELGRVDEALDVIDADISFEADQLRAEILWRAREWDRAAVVFKRLIGSRPATDETLDQQRSRFVLNLAVALSLGGDRAALDALRRDFGGAMQRTEFAYDFRVIAADDSTPEDFNSALARVASVDDFQAFLDNYRERLGRSAAPAG